MSVSRETIDEWSNLSLFRVVNVSRETLLPEVRFAQMFHVKHLKRRDLNVSRETFLYTEGIRL